MMMPGAMPQTPVPATPPAVNPQQLAEQQQAFINQQALLMVRRLRTGHTSEYNINIYH